MKRAVFLDRDGIIIKLVYDLESGTIDSAHSEDQVKLNFGIIELIKKAIQLGYLIIVISNQSGIGLGKFTKKAFSQIQQKIRNLLKQYNITLDKEYYCFHHPFAVLPQYQKICSCRKPKIGMLTQASSELNIDLTKSWVVGDGIQDVIAGNQAGCKTILLANINESAYLEILEKQLKGNKPTHIVKSLIEAQHLI